MSLIAEAVLNLHGIIIYRYFTYNECLLFSSSMKFCYLCFAVYY